jgi:hypothetical protein
VLSNALNGEGDEIVAGSVQPESENIDGRRSESSRQVTPESVPKILGKGQGAPRPPKRSPDSPHWNLGRTFRKPWAGGWGPLGDPRSKLYKLALRIEATELEPVYGRVDDVGVQNLMRECSQWKALARMMLSRIGIDKEATVRKASGMSRMGSSKEAELARLVGRRKPWEPQSGLELAAYQAAEEAKKKNTNTPSRRTRA